MPALSASTYTYLWREGLATAIEEIADAGFGGVELMAAPPHVELARDVQATAAAAREACRRASLDITSVAAGFDVNLASPDGAMRAWSLAYYELAGRFAAQVGAPYLVVHPGRRHPFKPAPHDSAREWVIDGLARIADALRDEGVRPLLENTPSTILDTAAECAAVVRAVGVGRLGVCYDAANGMIVEDPAQGLRAVADLVQLVHLSDTTAEDWRHGPIGTGEGDFAALAATADEVGYSGPVVVETIHPGRPRAGLEADRRALQQAGWAAIGTAPKR